jgi:hypothetical protein
MGPFVLEIQKVRICFLTTIQRDLPNPYSALFGTDPAFDYIYKKNRVSLDHILEKRN